MKSITKKHWYPASNATQQPSNLWYYGRALYVSRYDYRKIFLVFIAVGIPLGVLGLIFSNNYLWLGAWALGALGLVLLFYSLFGLYRQYGTPANGYFKKMLLQAEVKGKVKVVDVHIGTYRHSYKLAEELPEATIYSIDYWNAAWPMPELAIQDVRDLEFAPANHDRIVALKAEQDLIQLDDASCDVVVLGFGTHEIHYGESRQTLFKEAKRILKLGGKVILFEHGYDFHNYLIFGPVINHVTKLKDWKEIMENHFSEVKITKTSYAVNILTAVKYE